MSLLKVFSRSPLTLRGVIILLVLGYFLQGAVARESDVIATVMVFLLSALELLVGVLIALKGRTLRKLLVVEILPPVEGLYGKIHNQVAVRLPSFGVPPLTNLTLELLFEQDGVESPLLSFSGRSNEPRVLSHSVVFPHRGNWTVGKAKFSLEDRLGLCRCRWEGALAETSRSLLVQPAPVEGSDLPVVSSSERAGDLATATNERVGDPYDLKPYHPGDGVRKILWKIFAKSGQLLSRTPEASMTPEGQVVVFCVADREDDRVASHCVEYFAHLEQIGLVVFAGCEGMDDSAPLAQSPAALQDLLIEYVWRTPKRDEPAHGTEEIDRLLLEVAQLSQFSRVTKVVLFVSASRLASESGAEALISYGEELVRHNVEPVIFVLDREALPTEPSKETTGLTKLLRPLLYVVPERKEESRSRERFLGALSKCGSRSWEVVT